VETENIADCPLDGYTWLQEQRNLHSDITEEAEVKFKVNNVSYSRKDQGTDRQNEQILNLSSSSTNTGFFPLLKSIKAVPKPIPVTVNNEQRINNRDNNMPSLKHKLSSTVHLISFSINILQVDIPGCGNGQYEYRVRIYQLYVQNNMNLSLKSITTIN
jgi:hypothetical protein